MKPISFNERWAQLEQQFPSSAGNPIKYSKISGRFSNVVGELDLNIYGVYCIFGMRQKKSELIYIGMSGTVLSDGTMRKQVVGERLKKTACKKTKNKQTVYRVSRDELFSALVGVEKDQLANIVDYYPRLQEFEFEELEFHWIDTYTTLNGLPPALVEAELLWCYLSEHGHLPIMNKEF